MGFLPDTLFDDNAENPDVEESLNELTRVVAERTHSVKHSSLPHSERSGSHPSTLVRAKTTSCHSPTSRSSRGTNTHGLELPRLLSLFCIVPFLQSQPHHSASSFGAWSSSINVAVPRLFFLVPCLPYPRGCCVPAFLKEVVPPSDGTPPPPPAVGVCVPRVGWWF